MHLTLSRVVASDFDAILPVQFKTFLGIDVSTVFFGLPNPKNYAGTKARILRDFNNDPADLWLKIVDEDEEVEYNVLDDQGMPIRKATTKRIVCASNWKIYPTYVAVPEQAPPVPGASENGHADPAELKVQKRDQITWLETTQEREDALLITEDFMARRRKTCKEAHILLFLLYVDPEYQRKGVGSMMMKWGGELADQMMLPCWLEASPFGHDLYAKYGYEDMEKVHLVTKSFVSEYTHMRRPLKVNGMRGPCLERF